MPRATVEIVPVAASMRRIRSRPSATKTLPAASTATPVGSESRARAAGPPSPARACDPGPREDAHPARGGVGTEHAVTVAVGEEQVAVRLAREPVQ